MAERTNIVEELMRRAPEMLERLVEREYRVRLDFTEPLLGSRPTTSIAARWLEQKEREALASELRRGASRAELHRAAGDTDDLDGARTDYYAAPPGSEGRTEAAGVANAAALELAEPWIASSTAGEAPEDASPDDALPLNPTGFSVTDDGRLHLWDFQIMGAMKGTTRELDMRIAGRTGKDVSAARQVQTMAWVFSAEPGEPYSRRLYLMRDGEHITEPDGLLDRPLRAMTMKGERVSIAVSERLDPPCSVTFRVVLVRGCKLTDDHMRDMFAYFMLQGMGQWRSGGWGRAIPTIERVR